MLRYLCTRNLCTFLLITTIPFHQFVYSYKTILSVLVLLGGTTYCRMKANYILSFSKDMHVLTILNDNVLCLKQSNKMGKFGHKLELDIMEV